MPGTGAPHRPAQPSTAIWRNAWLAPSETFVRDQMAAMTRWSPVRVGLRRLTDSLTPADLTVLGPSRIAEWSTEALGSFGHRRRIAAFLSERQVELVHAHFAPDGMSALPVATRLDVPLVVTCHGYDVNRLPNLGRGIGREYRRRLRHLFDRVDTLVAVSEFIARQLGELGAPADRIRVLSIGIDTLDGVEPPPYEGRAGVSFAARLVAKKGVLDLVQAWAALPRDLRYAHPLRIAGTGPLAGRLAAAAAAVDGPLELLGHRPSAEVAALLDRSAVYAQPSRTAEDGDAEGLGMVFLEAALHRVPVVAYDHGPVPEAVLDRRTGLLAPEGDVAGLTARLQELLTDPARADELGAAGRKRVLAEFDIDRCTGDLENLYDQLTGRRPGR